MSSTPPLLNRYSGIVHAMSECDDCEWTTESPKNALANASLHARRTGHTVRCEQVMSVIYNRKDKPNE